MVSPRHACVISGIADPCGTIVGMVSDGLPETRVAELSQFLNERSMVAKNLETIMVAVRK